MATSKEATPAAKPKLGKVAAAKAETAKKIAASGAKTESKKAAPSGKTVKVTQVQGTIARKWDQEATLRGLGLGKRHRTRVLQDTPEVRGMIYKVRHLLKVEQG